MKDIVLIDGLCYLYPHKPELVATHPSMRGVWETCLQLLRQPNSFMSPLLIDDIHRDMSSEAQSLEDVLMYTIGKDFNDLPWFGEPVLESKIEQRYGNLGCKIFDSIYHRDVILAVALFYDRWRYATVLPSTFMPQQAGMYYDLWKFIYGHVNFNLLANRLHLSTEYVRNAHRCGFLSHFENFWIDDHGKLIESTNPVYKKGQIHHEASAKYRNPIPAA